MNTQLDPSALISVESRAQIDAWLAKYPPEQRQSAVLHALHVRTRFQQAQTGELLPQRIVQVPITSRSRAF